MKPAWGFTTVLLFACGGEATGGVAGATASPSGGESAGGALMFGDAGAQESAGGGRDVEPPLIGSATRYCDNDNYCFGLACYAPESWLAHACVETCARDTDCQPGEVCLQSAELEAGCYHQCETPRDCRSGFDCFDFANAQTMLVCFPTSWATYWVQNHF